MARRSATADDPFISVCFGRKSVMKKRLLCAVLLLAVAALCACDASILQIRDENGDGDASLVTLTEEDLLDPMPQVIKQGAKRSGDRDAGITTFTVEKMSGVEVLDSFTADEESTYTLTVTSSRTAGNLRLYVSTKDAIVRDIPIGSEQQITLTGLSGVVSVRAAAESAAFSVTITRV